MTGQDDKRFVANRGKFSETINDVSSLEKLTKPIAPDNAVGRLSRMEMINTKGANEAALNTAVRKLGIALANIYPPAIDACYECGEQIPLGRSL